MPCGFCSTKTPKSHKKPASPSPGGGFLRNPGGFGAGGDFGFSLREKPYGQNPFPLNARRVPDAPLGRAQNLNKFCVGFILFFAVGPPLKRGGWVRGSWFSAFGFFCVAKKTTKTSLPEGGLLFREPLGRGEQKTTIVECLIQ